LLDFPVVLSGKCEYSLIRHALCDSGKGLVIINSLLLQESFHNPAGLIAARLAVLVVFKLIDPSALKRTEVRS